MSDEQRLVDASSRRRPNILITGTPGVGKTATASRLAERAGMRHIHVTEVIKQNQCFDGRDDELDSFFLDEDKLLDIMETMMEAAADDGAGIVADYHSAELFPERWFDLVLVLRTSTDVLFDRLTKRGYSEKKRAENMECEIMQLLLDEAREAYAPDIVHECPSNTLEDIETNVDRAIAWCEHWVLDNGKEQS